MFPSLSDKLMSASDAEKLIHAHDGEVALLYIFRALSGSNDPEQAATALCRTLREVQAAEEKLSRMGLDGIPSPSGALPASPSPAAFSPAALSPAPMSVPAPQEELPQYRAEDITRRCREDAAFAAVLDEARKVMGRNLSSVDMKSLFAIYDYLGLPVDVLMLLINYCGRVFEEKYQGQRRPTAKALQKEADTWARLEIMTMEQAEEYMRRQEERRSAMHRVKEALGIHGRELSATERDYINGWLDMGFDEACLAIAYDRTLTNTGALKWSYMHKILLSWKEKGLFTEKDILEKDARRSASPGSRGKAGQAAGKPIDFSNLDTLIDQI